MKAEYCEKRSEEERGYIIPGRRQTTEMIYSPSLSPSTCDMVDTRL